MTAEFIVTELQSVANPEKAAFLQGFFKTGPGQYAEGDIFLGLTNPVTRNIAKANKWTLLSELQKLIESPFHEARLCALVIAVEKFKKAKEAERKEIFDFYLRNTRYINNWDLVDVTCPHIVGAYLLDKDRSILYKLAKSKFLWEERIAMVSTVTFIRNRQFDDTLSLASYFLTHKHDLMHKAVGWMLREVGKKDREVLSAYLDSNATKMPHTALRYAIEHYPEDMRQYYLKMKK
ncbi:MAG: DNA alkylation repair protein [Tannerellaceae bacterium]|nr:DNA alkylation repair protein [Tannerellaceae bacterium]